MHRLGWQHVCLQRTTHLCILLSFIFIFYFLIPFCADRFLEVFHAGPLNQSMKVNKEPQLRLAPRQRRRKEKYTQKKQTGRHPDVICQPALDLSAASHAARLAITINNSSPLIFFFAAMSGLWCTSLNSVVTPAAKKEKAIKEKKSGSKTNPRDHFLFFSPQSLRLLV